MKSQILDSKGKSGSMELPENFSAQIRKDVLLKAFEAQKRFQEMGNTPFAGMKYSASGTIRRKRHSWKSGYGRGAARTPRKVMSRHGSSFNWVGATAANTRGGRQSHPPRTEENQFRKINKKELLIAMNSGFAGTADKISVNEKYHMEAKECFFVAKDSMLSLKSKDFFKIMKEAFGEAYEKILQHKTQRAGKGKTRGRTYKSNAGMLFVVASDEKMNRKGIDVVKVNELMIKDLAPNGEPGRFACYTEKAIKEIGDKYK
jgi:large subunit ribosomal protein L4e